MVYDAADGYTLLFGGGIHAVGVSDDDTWEYSGGNWTQLHPPTSPAGRLGAGMVYDSRDGYVVLFGGFNETSSTFRNDTWKFSQGTWTKLSPTHAPSPRWLIGFSYDTSLGEAVLFGGGNFAPLGETWTFANGQWALRAPAGPSPPWRSDSALAYDSAGGESVMFGGNANASVLGDTWTFTGNTTILRWTNATTSVHPPAQTDFGLAFDSELGRLVLASINAPATWSFSRGSWSDLTSLAPSTYSARSHFSLADDPKDGYLLLFGGSTSGGYSSDTWALDGFTVKALTQTPNPGEVGVNVTFATTSSGGVAPFTDSWTFGATGASTLASPSELFYNPGVVNVTVDLTDGWGVTGVGGVSLVVEPRLAASIQGPLNETEVGGILRLSALTTGGIPPYSYVWGLPGGGVATGPRANVTFTSAGNPDINVTATDSIGGQTIAFFPSSVAADPVPHIAVSSTSLATGASITVQASVQGGVAPYRYSWAFGDGTDASGASATHSYPNTGSYQIVLTVNDSLGFARNTSATVNVASPSGLPGGISPILLAGIAVVAAAGAGAAIWLVRRRRVPPSPP